jgi:hypothetical protein
MIGGVAGKLSVEVWRAAEDGEPYRLTPAYWPYRAWQRLRGRTLWRVLVRDETGNVAWSSEAVESRARARAIAADKARDS